MGKHAEEAIANNALVVASAKNPSSSSSASGKPVTARGPPIAQAKRGGKKQQQAQKKVNNDQPPLPRKRGRPRKKPRPVWLSKVSSTTSDEIVELPAEPKSSSSSVGPQAVSAAAAPLATPAVEAAVKVEQALFKVSLPIPQSFSLQSSQIFISKDINLSPSLGSMLMFLYKAKMGDIPVNSSALSRDKIRGGVIYVYKKFVFDDADASDMSWRNDGLAMTRFTSKRFPIVHTSNTITDEMCCTPLAPGEAPEDHFRRRAVWTDINPNLFVVQYLGKVENAVWLDQFPPTPPTHNESQSSSNNGTNKEVAKEVVEAKPTPVAEVIELSDDDEEAKNTQQPSTGQEQQQQQQQPPLPKVLTSPIPGLQILRSSEVTPVKTGGVRNYQDSSATTPYSSGRGENIASTGGRSADSLPPTSNQQNSASPMAKRQILSTPPKKLPAGVLPTTQVRSPTKSPSRGRPGFTPRLAGGIPRLGTMGAKIVARPRAQGPTSNMRGIKVLRPGVPRARGQAFRPVVRQPGIERPGMSRPLGPRGLVPNSSRSQVPGGRGTLATSPRRLPASPRGSPRGRGGALASPRRLQAGSSPVKMNSLPTSNQPPAGSANAGVPASLQARVGAGISLTKNSSGKTPPPRSSTLPAHIQARLGPGISLSSPGQRSETSSGSGASSSSSVQRTPTKPPSTYSSAPPSSPSSRARALNSLPKATNVISVPRNQLPPLPMPVRQRILVQPRNRSPQKVAAAPTYTTEVINIDSDDEDCGEKQQKPQQHEQRQQLQLMDDATVFQKQEEMLPGEEDWRSELEEGVEGGHGEATEASEVETVKEVVGEKCGQAGIIKLRDFSQIQSPETAPDVSLEGGNRSSFGIQIENPVSLSARAIENALAQTSEVRGNNFDDLISSETPSSSNSDQLTKNRPVQNTTPSSSSAEKETPEIQTISDGEDVCDIIEEVASIKKENAAKRVEAVKEPKREAFGLPAGISLSRKVSTASESAESEQHNPTTEKSLRQNVPVDPVEQIKTAQTSSVPPKVLKKRKKIVTPLRRNLVETRMELKLETQARIESLNNASTVPDLGSSASSEVEKAPNAETDVDMKLETSFGDDDQDSEIVQDLQDHGPEETAAAAPAVTAGSSVTDTHESPFLQIPAAAAEDSSSTSSKPVVAAAANNDEDDDDDVIEILEERIDKSGPKKRVVQVVVNEGELSALRDAGFSVFKQE